MKFIFASKFYYRRGGLEAYLFKSKQLLEDNGHEVIPFSTNYHKNIPSDFSEYFCEYMDLSQINKLNVGKNIRAFKNMFFNGEVYAKTRRLCEENGPDILQGFGVTKHLSASVFKAAKDSGVKTVMRLSDFALICPNSIGLDGANKVCMEFDCTTKNNFKCIRKCCIQNSLLASVLGFLETKGNLLLDGYRKNVDNWIAPSRFMKRIFSEKYCVDAEKITYIPIYFDASDIEPSVRDDDYILYAGNIDRFKGILTLLEAAEQDRSLPVKIAGAGPLEKEVRNIVAKKNLDVELLGFQDFASLQETIRCSSMIVVPSECFENSPNIVLEAYAQGKPVVGSNIGGIPELIKDRETGYLFEPRDSEDLLNKIHVTMENRKELGKNARCFLEENFTPSGHYKLLSNFYSKVMGNA